mmetsp:Transcript_14547/g.31562  ORF Transcript_14547/g.31562 Transcript_14547/m.31562 type:complete len:1355 (-) Transcript_14547:67-4131(-)
MLSPQLGGSVVATKVRPRPMEFAQVVHTIRERRREVRGVTVWSDLLNTASLVPDDDDVEQQDTDDSEHLLLSVVLATRNDEYTSRARLLNMLEFVIRGISDAFMETSAEIVIVEYKPLPEYVSLRELLRGHDICFGCSVPIRIVTVDLPDTPPRFLEHIAKNIGARRARGRWLMLTTTDVVISSSVFKFIAMEELSTSMYYRMPRGHLPAALDNTAPYEEREQVASKVASKGFIMDEVEEEIWDHGDFLTAVEAPEFSDGSVEWKKLAHTGACSGNVDPWLDEVPGPGDFLLVSKEAYAEVGGAPEVPCTLHIDTLLNCRLYSAGLAMVVLQYPCFLQHMHHTRNFTAVKSNLPGLCKEFPYNATTPREVYLGCDLVISGGERSSDRSQWGHSSHTFPEHTLCTWGEDIADVKEESSSTKEDVEFVAAAAEFDEHETLDNATIDDSQASNNPLYFEAIVAGDFTILACAPLQLESEHTLKLYIDGKLRKVVHGADCTHANMISVAPEPSDMNLDASNDVTMTIENVNGVVIAQAVSMLAPSATWWRSNVTRPPVCYNVPILTEIYLERGLQPCSEYLDHAQQYTIHAPVKGRPHRASMAPARSDPVVDATPTVVLFHAGRRVPPCVRYAAYQVAQSNPSVHIMLVITPDAFVNSSEWFLPGTEVEVVSTDTLPLRPDVLQHLDLHSSLSQRRHRASLAVWSLVRFFYVEELMRQRGLVEVYQLETDCLLFANLSLTSRVLRRNHIELAATLTAEDLGSGSVVYASDGAAMGRLNDALLSAHVASSDLSEMALLSRVASSVNLTMLPLLPHGRDRALALELGWLAAWHVGPWLSGGYVTESVEDPGLEFGHLWRELRRANLAMDLKFRLGGLGWWPLLTLTDSLDVDSLQRRRTESFPIGLLHIGSKVTGLFTSKTFAVEDLVDEVHRPNVSFIAPQPAVPVMAGPTVPVQLDVQRFLLSHDGHAERVNGWPAAGYVEVWLDGVSVGRYASNKVAVQKTLATGPHELTAALWSPDEHVYVSFTSTVMFHVGRQDDPLHLSNVGSLTSLGSQGDRVTTPHLVWGRHEGGVTQIVLTAVRHTAFDQPKSRVSGVSITRNVGTLRPTTFGEALRLMWTECTQPWAGGDCSVWTASWDGRHETRIRGGWLASPPCRRDGQLVAVIGQPQYFGHSLSLIFSADDGESWETRGDVKVPYKNIAVSVSLTNAGDWGGGWLMYMLSLRGVSISVSHDSGFNWSPVAPLPSSPPFVYSPIRGIPGSRHLYRVHFVPLSAGRLLRFHAEHDRRVLVAASTDPSFWGTPTLVVEGTVFVAMTALEHDMERTMVVGEDEQGRKLLSEFHIDWELLRVTSSPFGALEF